MDVGEFDYEYDLFAWTQRQAAALRLAVTTGETDRIDWLNIAEEIESLGGRQRSEAHDRLYGVTACLLKLLYCPHLKERNHRLWRVIIRQQRNHLEYIFDDSPSLRAKAEDIFVKVYPDARKMAAAEADVPLKTFPKQPPFTLEQALDPRYPSELFPPEDDEDPES